MRVLTTLHVLFSTATCIQAGVISSRQAADAVTYATPKLCPKKQTSTSNSIASGQISGSVSNTLPGPAASPVNIATLPGTDHWYEVTPDDIPSAKGNLPQTVTNGYSSLGSLAAPKYPAYVGSQGSKAAAGACPWGNKTAAGTNPYHDPPNTGMVRRYTFDIQRGTLAPDGVPRSVILVNGEFPGPTIEANWGDWFEIEVTNNIQGPSEGTSLHWHGILQKDMPWEDGVPGISQCPIAPGQTFTYKFRADLYGTSWWHAHYSAQYAAGIFGAMIIHGPTDNAQYDIDLGPVLITDYFHEDYFTLVEHVMSNDINSVLVFSDNNLINGKGIYNCSLAADPTTCDPNAGLAKFNFQKGKSYRLRLINAGVEGLQKFSIDGHKLWVIAYDFVPIVPYETEVVTLAVAQRADVVVIADGDTDGAHWMRSAMGSKCSLTKQPNAYAMVYYDNADTDTKPNSTAWVDNTDPCANDDLATSVPFHPMTPPEPDMEIEIDITFGPNATGHFLWYVNNSTYKGDFNNPVLPMIMNGGGKVAGDYPKPWNVYDVGKSKSVRITLNNLTPVPHPMHLHGHNMYVLSATHPPYPAPPTSTNSSAPTNSTTTTSSSTPTTVFTSTTTSIATTLSVPATLTTSTTSIVTASPIKSLATTNETTVLLARRQTKDTLSSLSPTNTLNPTRRDTQIIAPFGQIVLQFDGDNPGVWPLHCHIAWHVSGGLYVNLVEDAESMRAMNPPDTFQDLCKSWQSYTDGLAQDGQFVDVIDSGLRMPKLRMLEKER